MFRNAIEGIKQKIWPANETNKSPEPIHAASRLAKIQYDPDKIPDYFNCPISLCIMENPVMVNHLQSHTFDQDNLSKCDHPTRDPLGLDFIIINEKRDIIPNDERHHQIEMFVSTLEQIHQLKHHLETLVKIKIKIRDLNAAIQDTEITPEELPLLLPQLFNEQREEHKKAILQTKLQLAMELQAFIALTETVIHAEDKKHEDKLDEIKKITFDSCAYLELLKDELTPIYPDLFPNHFDLENDSISITCKVSELELLKKELAANYPDIFPGPPFDFENDSTYLDANDEYQPECNIPITPIQASLYLQQIVSYKKPLLNFESSLFYSNPLLTVHPAVILMVYFRLAENLELVKEDERCHFLGIRLTNFLE